MSCSDNSLAKTEGTLFTRRRPFVNNFVKIIGNALPWKSDVKYLGLYLDFKLKFNNHINKVDDQSLGLICSLFPFLNRYCHLNMFNKKNYLYFRSVYHTTPLYGTILVQTTIGSCKRCKINV